MINLHKILSLTLGVAFPLISSALNPNIRNSMSDNCRCLPTESCWPTEKEWQDLGKSLKGKLIKPESLLVGCKTDTKAKQCQQQLKYLKNPFYIQTQVGGTQTQGWFQAWDSTPSVYAVDAEDTKDVVAAVNFARKYNLRLVIKGAGHDYLGRSSAPDSLLVWTHHMRQVSYESNFVPIGAPKTESTISVITVGAGTRWVEAYNVATTEHGKYVQGGGCTSVGAAGGFTQGGGFGSFSKKFGTGAAGVVQVEVVTANGQVIVANNYQHQDLFWAIRGGGGGTYGVVTKMTLRLHDLPSSVGIYQGVIEAKNNLAFRKLIEKFLGFFANNLDNENWGEQFAFNNQNQLQIFLVYQGLDSKQINKIWQPFTDWIESNPKDYKISIKVLPINPRGMWDYKYLHQHYPEMVTANTAPGASPGEFWWTSNTDEASRYIYTYQSLWLPESLFSSQVSLEKLSSAFMLHQG